MAAVRAVPDVPGARRHVPFGAGWAMPVEVSVSEWAIDNGIAWSCGQCPLDARGAVVAPGDVDVQAGLVAGCIQAALARAGLVPEGILAMVVYGIEPARSAAILGARMPAGVPIVPVGVPPLYYPGMTLEVDVIAAEMQPARRGDPWARAASAAGLTAVGWTAGATERATVGARVGSGGLVTGDLPSPAQLAREAGRDGGVVSALLALPQGMSVPPGWPPASVRRVPPGAPVAALLLLAHAPVETVGVSDGGVALEVADAGRLLQLTAWCPGDSGIGSGGIGAEAGAAMAAVVDALTARGLGAEALLKVTAHHVGEGAEALHESLAARHRHHARPAPASTGLGVAGLGVAEPGPDGATVVIEAIASRPAS